MTFGRHLVFPFGLAFGSLAKLQEWGGLGSKMACPIWIGMSGFVLQRQYCVLWPFLCCYFWFSIAGVFECKKLIPAKEFTKLVQVSIAVRERGAGSCHFDSFCIAVQILHHFSPQRVPADFDDLTAVGVKF